MVFQVGILPGLIPVHDGMLFLHISPIGYFYNPTHKEHSKFCIQIYLVMLNNSQELPEDATTHG